MSQPAHRIESAPVESPRRPLLRLADAPAESAGVRFERPVVDTTPSRRGEPRYELRVRRDGHDVLVWTRHRSRRLALLSRRMELGHLRLGEAELVVVDRRTQQDLSAA